MIKSNAYTNKYLKLAIFGFLALSAMVFAYPNSAEAGYYYVSNDYSYNRGGYYNNYSYRPGTNYYETGYSNNYSVSYYPQTYSTYAYYYPQQYYPLTVSCAPDRTFAAIGETVTWVANVSGGNGAYTFNWDGTSGLYGSQMAVNAHYNSSGVKTATVYVTSAGQQMSIQCSNSVTVGIPSNVVYNNVYTTPIYTTPVVYNTVNTNTVTSTGIQIACFADTTTVRVGVPVTWAVEVTGMTGNLTYAWTGSDGLSGNQSSVITTYVTPGLKSAVVTVSSSNGQSQSKACGNTINIQNVVSNTSVAKKTTKPAPVAVATPAKPVNEEMSAAALFSLKNIPWGLVGLLVILILFVAVIYLLFNKRKI